MTRGKRLWAFDDQERGVLLEATPHFPTLRAVLERAQQRSDLGGRWLVQSTVAELDEMYSLVEALMDATRGRKRLEILEGLRASLCHSIDGF